MKLGRPVSARLGDGVGEAFGVVGVLDLDRVPAIAAETVEHVFGKGEVGRALDGDLVAVIDPGEVAEAEMAGNRGRLAGHPLHHVAVAGERVDMVVEDREVRFVVARGEVFLRHRHADGIAAALPERTGGGFDAGGQAIFRMARRLAVELAELLEVVERERRAAAILVLVDRPDADQMDQAVEQHRGVADREDEAIAVRPVRVVRIVVHEALPERVGDGRERHRRSRMAGVRLLHRVHRQSAHRVDAELVDAGRGRRLAADIGCSIREP